jgi:hypothetical protein
MILQVSIGLSTGWAATINTCQDEPLQRKTTMRDRRFIAHHRGGPLKKEQHRQLITWAIACATHVLPLIGEKPDERLEHALLVAKAWAEGNAPTGAAMKGSAAAHAVARESSDPASLAAARSVGQAVATAHRADHARGAAWYALKAVKSAGKSTDAEREWQDEHLPPEIRDLVLSARKGRGI